LALQSNFNIVLSSWSRALVQALGVLVPFARAQASAYKIFQVIRHEPSINKPEKSSQTLETVKGQIQLCNVEFSYPSRPDVPIFRDFSLTISPGASVAIVGSSGSGKSTIISLIERFYDPTAGMYSARLRLDSLS
jgi:ATP-binding cassette subfamily B (MDR/TAP) protein 1